eukprot:281817-Chlamydomonas_euryale.AAC.3
MFRRKRCLEADDADVASASSERCYHGAAGASVACPMHHLQGVPSASGGGSGTSASPAGSSKRREMECPARSSLDVWIQARRARWVEPPRAVRELPEKMRVSQVRQNICPQKCQGALQIDPRQDDSRGRGSQARRRRRRRHPAASCAPCRAPFARRSTIDGGIVNTEQLHVHKAQTVMQLQPDH